MDIIVKALSAENLDDFLYFFDHVAFADNPDWDGCYCYYYHFGGTTDEWMKRTKEDNRKDTADFVINGKLQGYLAYNGDEVVGWCNANDKNCYARLVNEKAIWENAEEKVCSIVCYLIATEHRGKGIATSLLRKVCDDKADKGYDYIEAYPRKGDLSCSLHYHGPLSMYEKAGFRIYKELKQYYIVRKKLNSL